MLLVAFECLCINLRPDFVRLCVVCYVSTSSCITFITNVHLQSFLRALPVQLKHISCVLTAFLHKYLVPPPWVHECGAPHSPLGWSPPSQLLCQSRRPSHLQQNKNTVKTRSCLFILGSSVRLKLNIDSL